MVSASRMLNIAQSAVTKSILELEDTLGIKLFERTSKGMILTQEGHRFQVSARHVITAVAQASLIERAEPEQLSGAISIGVTTLVAGYYLADLIARFKKSHPSVFIQLVEDQPQFLEHLLINGEIDCALMVSNALSNPTALQVEVLTASSNRVWMSSNHPLAHSQEVTLSDCAKYPLIVLETDRIDSLMQALWSRKQLNPNIAMRSGSLEAVRSLVGVGLGIAVLPDFLYRPWTLDAEHIEARALRDDIAAINIGLVWRRGTTIRLVVEEFIQVAKEQSKTSRLRRST